MSVFYLHKDDVPKNMVKTTAQECKSPLPVDVRHALLKLPIATQVKLYTHATITHACNIFGHRFHFDAFLTVFTLTGYVRVFVLIHFQERF